MVLCSFHDHALTHDLNPADAMPSKDDSYSPSECVRLLEEAQCGDEADASQALRAVVMRLRAPHATVTAAALDILVVHPAATIPHIPDLITGSPADVTSVVQAFGDLLPTDRGLLVPILGAMSEMPLSRAHEEAARATLRFALDTVDGDDVPVVARALLRCAGAGSLARSAVATLRTALHRELTPQAATLLAHVVSEHARAAGPVGRALRAAAGEGGISPVDLVVWVVCLQRPQATAETSATDAAAAVSASVRNGSLLGGDLTMLFAAVAMVAAIAEDMPQGVVALVNCIVSAFSETVHQTEALSAAVLVRLLLQSCPAATNQTLADLARTATSRTYSGKAAHAILLGLTNLVLVKPGVRANFLSPSPVPKVAVAVALHAEFMVSEQTHCPAWNEVFLRMRKGLVFGSLSDKMVACSLAYIASRKATVPILKQVVSLMHSTIPIALTDGLASSFLLVLGNAVWRGAVDANLAATLFEQRVESQVPKGLFSIWEESTRNENSNARSEKNSSISIDIAVIKDKTASAVSAVAASGISLICHQMIAASPTKSATTLAVNAAVLVPSVCLPLYEASQAALSDMETREESRRERDPMAKKDTDFQPEIPEHLRKVLSMTDSQFQEALKGCMTSIAALVGLINVSCTTFPIFSQVLQNRFALQEQPIEKGLQADLWALHERVSELLIMVHAVSFGLNGCADAANDATSGSDEDEGAMEDTRAGIARLIPAELKSRLSRTLHAHMERCQWEPEKQSVLEYPTLNFTAVISSLVAIPEAKGIGNLDDNIASIARRDPEFGRMEEFLFRRLFCILQGPICMSRVRENAEDANENSPGTLPLPALSRKEHEKLISALDDPHSNLEDVFYGDSSDDDDAAQKPAKQKKRRKNFIENVQWASPLPVSDDGVCVESIFDECTLDGQGEEPDSSQVLYSPEFCALLLDRAATNTVVACVKRRGLKNSSNTDSLAALVGGVGFSLRIFAHVLMNMPVLNRMDSANGLHGDHEIQSTREFIATTGTLMKTRVRCHGGPQQVSMEDILPCATDGQAYVFGVLKWVCQKSIDVASSVLALDCLSLLAEYGVLHSGHVRELILASSSAVHEYDEGALWSAEDLKLVFAEDCQDWIARRRTAGTGAVFEDENTAVGPWLTVDGLGVSNARFLAVYRLRLIFNGLCIEDAGRETCAWTEQLWKDVRGDEDMKEEGSTEISKLQGLDVYATFEFLLMVLHNGLQQLRSDPIFSLTTTAAAQAMWFVRAFRAAVGAMEHLKFDHRFAHALAVLLGHSKHAVDALTAQYSSINTDVADLEVCITDDLQQLAVSLSQAADEASKLAAQLKLNSVATAMDGRMGTAVLRVRRSVPRLQTNAEAARRSAAGLAKAVGKSARVRQVSIGDGVRGWRARLGGLSDGADVKYEGQFHENSDNDDEIKQEEGLHSSVPDGDAKGNTVVVSFRNAR